MVFKKWSCIGLAMSLAAAGAMAASVVVVSAASVVIVTHDGQHGWHSRITDGSGTADPTYGSVTFVAGPNPMPAGNGVGSLRLMTNPTKTGTPPMYSHGDGSAQMRNTNYSGTSLSALTELNYWAYHTSVVDSTNQQQWPYLSLNVSCLGCSNDPTMPPTNTDTLFFEPPYQAPGQGGLTCAHQDPTVTDQWQKWDALGGCWWDNGAQIGSGGIDTRPLSDFIALHPDAAIINPNSLGGLRLAVGFASPTDQFDGNVDMVTIGVNGSSTAYNFEPPTCKEADGNGDFHSQDGRHGDVQVDNDKCEETGVGGNGESDQGDSVDSTNRGDGQDFHSTRIESTQFDATAGTMTMTGVGTTNGAPVAFTLIAVGTNLTSLGSITMIFSDGYTITGDLIDGLITLN